MSINIALAGNPNSGKTTLFNNLTGSSQYVGNWPGVTVEKKEGKLKGRKDITIIDLPGIYSLSPYTLEEVVTRDYLVTDKPDVVINIVDASNIERNLYLTTQLLETGIPVIIALNMMDIIQKNGDLINVDKLSKALLCPIVEISALKGTATKELLEKAIEIAKGKKPVPFVNFYDKKLSPHLVKIKSLIDTSLPLNELNYFTIKLFERDEKATTKLSLQKETKSEIEEIIISCEKDLDDDSESIITDQRYKYITEIVEKSVKKKNIGLTPSDKIDKIVTNRWLALPIFAAIMWLVYYVSVSSLGAIVTDWTNEVLFGEYIMGLATTFLTSINAADWLTGLVVDGIIGGVGAVLGFVPQMFILFFFLSILEDCGYMARVAFIMDRIFRKFGLSGKSFIPMLISSGCGVPGIMSTRTIENEKDRKITIMVTTFIPCGAKLPIIALIAAAFFPDSSIIAPSVYFLGIAMVIISGIILKKTKLFSGDPAPFVMELPQYHIPAPRSILTHMWERGKSFIVKAGTIVFVACGVIWFLSNFNFSLEMVDAGESILAAIGNVIAPIFAPLGFGYWQTAVATISGLVAKENVVGTFGVLFGLGAEIAEDDPGLANSLGFLLNGVQAYSFLAFNMICAPCFAAIGAIKREMGNWKWTFIAIGYQTLLAYILALIINQLGSFLLLGQTFGFGTIIAILLLIISIWLVIRPAYKKKK